MGWRSARTSRIWTFASDHRAEPSPLAIFDSSAAQLFAEFVELSCVNQPAPIRHTLTFQLSISAKPANVWSCTTCFCGCCRDTDHACDLTHCVNPSKSQNQKTWGLDFSVRYTGRVLTFEVEDRTLHKTCFILETFESIAISQSQAPSWESFLLSPRTFKVFLSTTPHIGGTFCNLPATALIA